MPREVLSCCAGPTYDKFFDERQARRDAKEYRRKGLDPAARWMVGVARDQGIDGATALEGGGGVGALQIELLKSGAARSTIVELSRGYDDEAARLARESGVEQRIQRRIGNLSSTDVEPADIVVLHRVVCCYPDYAELLGAAAARARRLLVFTHPPGNVFGRLFVAVANAWLRLTRNTLRVFAHPPAALADAVRRHGLELAAERTHGFWRGLAFVRR
jgi:magnesium-protoporphyrin O-methyltransferase